MDDSSTQTTEESDGQSALFIDAPVGEINQILQGLAEEQSVPHLPEKASQAMGNGTTGIELPDLNGESRNESAPTTQGEYRYRCPLSIEEVIEQLPPGDEDGLVWNALIVPDEFLVDGKLKRGLNSRDFDLAEARIKPRRASLPIKASDFLLSLTKVPGSNGRGLRFIFNGVLNGWPALRCLELVALDQRRERDQIIEKFPTPRELLTGQIRWIKSWHVNEDGKNYIEPKHVLQTTRRIHRATLRGASWTSMGWSKDSPGFAFWFEAQRRQGPRLSYGTNMINALGDERCTHVHMISHRYAVARESPKDKLTYHSVCLLEWEHKRYSTVVEVAFLNGMGGYQGRSNWYDDRDNLQLHGTNTALYNAMPPEMICPWRANAAEVRCYDIPIQSFYAFQIYVAKYEHGPRKRFIDPRFTFSHAARLTFRSKRQIAQYLLNYISRNNEYGELKRNCQTFTADFCSFLAGKKDIAPFHPVNRIEYQNRTYLFLYDSHLYEKKKKNKDKQPPKS